MSLKDNLLKIAKEVSKRHKYVLGAKGGLENKYQQLKQWKPDTKSQKMSRIAGLSGIDLAWILFCLGKYLIKDLNTVFLDNQIIEKMKMNNKNLSIKSSDSEFKKIIKNLRKNYPKTAARLNLWLVYSMFVFTVIGGARVVQSGANKDIVKELKEDKDKEKRVNKIKTYNVNDERFKENFVNENWESIVAGLLEFETYREKPVMHFKESVCTYGPGLTWVYINGKQCPCKGEYKNIAKGFSEKEIWDQVRQHCLYKNEVMDRIQKSLKNNGFSEMTKEQILGLFFVGYQTPALVNKVVEKLKTAGEDEQKIIDSFIVGKEVKAIWRDGTNKRRWWCAMLYSGKISINDILKMDRDAFSGVKIKKVLCEDGHFMCDDATIIYAINQKNAKTGTVQEFMESDGMENIVDLAKEQRNKETCFYVGSENIKEIYNKKNKTIVKERDYYAA